MKNILKSMKDFVLEQKREMEEREEYEFLFGIAGRCFEYAEFLEKPLKLEMFIPTDEEGNPIKSSWCNLGKNCEDVMCTKYKEAEQKVIFEGWMYANEYNNNYISIYHKKIGYIKFYGDISVKIIDNFIETIEDLVPYELTVKY